MLAYIEGELIKKTNNAAIVKTGALAYKVFIKDKDLLSLKLNNQVSLCLYHHIKEDLSDLYGFLTWPEQEMFSLLLSVSGVGPKSALAILSMASIDDICQAVLSGESEMLTKVAGIGRKTAGRLVLELKNKLDNFSDNLDEKSQAFSFTSDELDALMSLGYSLIEAREALNLVDREISDSALKIKAALKIIGERK
jgi:holliday junction DNA helicase RuvA